MLIVLALLDLLVQVPIIAAKADAGAVRCLVHELPCKNR